MIQVKFREGFKGDLTSLDSGIREALRGTIGLGVPVDFVVATDKPYEAARRFYKRAEFQSET